MLKTQLQRSACYRTFCVWKDNSPSLTSILENLLEPDVHKRATINDIINSDWLQVIPCRQCKCIILKVSNSNFMQ